MANFAILRVAKMNNFGSLSASSQHNFRERVTKNADDERTTLNEIDGAKSTSDLVKAVSDLLPTKRRKDAVICIEYLISASPEHFGENWREEKNHGADYFTDAIEWLEKRHGPGNVVCTTVHLDESTPHLAAYVVPLTADGRLSAKDFVGGRSALSKMQTSFAAEVGAKHGLTRGVERSNAVHQDNAKIAPMTAERLALRKRVQVLEDEVDRLVKSAGAGGAALAAAQKELEQVQGDLVKSKRAMTKQQKLNSENFHEINRLNEKETQMDSYTKALQSELVASNEKLAVALEQRAAAIAAQVESGEKSAALLATVEGHKAAAEQLRKEALQGAQRATERDHELVAEITALRAENETAQASLEQLRAIDRVIVDQTRERLEQEASQEAQEAFAVKWVGAREATASEIQYAPVEEVCGRRVVYALGRQTFAIHTVELGAVMPQLAQTEKEKKGIAR